MKPRIDIFSFKGQHCAENQYGGNNGKFPKARVKKFHILNTKGGNSK